LTLFDISSPEDPTPQFVKVLDANVGKGVYAARPYPRQSVIGEITGQLFPDPYSGTDYTFEAKDGYQLEPVEPFRYLNHSCLPNCEFDWLEQPAGNGIPARAGLFLISLRDIFCEEEFTIDYRWPASHAIECQCKEPLCRGWIVDRSELGKLINQTIPS